MNRCDHASRHGRAPTPAELGPPRHHGSAKRGLLLVRHPEVDDAFRDVCYGQSDVPLSHAGQRACGRIARAVARHAVTHVLHSGLQRTRRLADAIAARTGTPPIEDVALRERDFGDWEMRRWQEIHQEHGDDMMRMISDPAGYRPGGGETTREFADRVWRWYRRAPGRGLCVAVCHGGTIAALLGRSRQLPVAQWPRLIPGCGQSVWHPGGQGTEGSRCQSGEFP